VNTLLAEYDTNGKAQNKGLIMGGKKTINKGIQRKAIAADSCFGILEVKNLSRKTIPAEDCYNPTPSLSDTYGSIIKKKITIVNEHQP